MEQYTILENKQLIKTNIPGEYAAHKKLKIFGLLSCWSGKKMLKINRVFFHDMRSAIQQGFRPCKNCIPMTQKDFVEYKDIIPFDTLQQFYDRD